MTVRELQTLLTGADPDSVVLVWSELSESWRRVEEFRSGAAVDTGWLGWVEKTDSERVVLLR